MRLRASFAYRRLAGDCIPLVTDVLCMGIICRFMYGWLIGVCVSEPTEVDACCDGICTEFMAPKWLAPVKFARDADWVEFCALLCTLAEAIADRVKIGSEVVVDADDVVLDADVGIT